MTRTYSRVRLWATVALIASLVLVVGLARAGAQDDPPPPPKSVDTSGAPAVALDETRDALLAAVAPYVGGEWTIDGAWSDGTPLKGREVYEWGVGKKFVHCKTFVTAPAGEYQRYETIFGVKDGKLMAWSFTYDGSSDSSEFKVEGKKLSSAKAMNTPQGEATLHQSIELVEPDKFRWLVAIESADGTMRQIMDGMWIRHRAAGEASTD